MIGLGTMIKVANFMGKEKNYFLWYISRLVLRYNRQKVESLLFTRIPLHEKPITFTLVSTH